MRRSLLTAALLLPLSVAPAGADELLETMIGNWEGAGQLTYTTAWTFPFRCEIEGRPAKVATQVDLLGKCWAGPIWSTMGAALRYNKKSKSYIGKFRDGTSTFVVDIRGRPVDNALALDLKQGGRRGAMAVAFRSRDAIELKVSVIDNGSQEQRQVVDLTLERKNTRLGALAQ